MKLANRLNKGGRYATARDMSRQERGREDYDIMQRQRTSATGLAGEETSMVLATWRPESNRAHGLEPNQERAHSRYLESTECAPISTGRGWWCATKRVIRELVKGGLLGHMTRRVPADRLIFRVAAAGSLLWKRVYSGSLDMARRACAPVLYGRAMVLWRLLLVSVLALGVPAALLRGTCAVQKKGGTVAGRSWVQTWVIWRRA
ncbi:hypothetical protein ACJQWK_10572 [Exserohilum turcicum]